MATQSAPVQVEHSDSIDLPGPAPVYSKPYNVSGTETPDSIPMTPWIANTPVSKGSVSSLAPVVSQGRTVPLEEDVESSPVSPVFTNNDGERAIETMQSFWDPPENRFRVVALCLTCFAGGLNDSAPGALLAYIEKNYSIGYAVVSTIFVANALGFISAAFFNNALTVRLGRSKTFAIAELILVAAYTLIVVKPPFPVIVVSFFLAGIGLAMILALGQVFISNLASNALLQGFYQGSYGIGGTIGPLIATTMVSKGFHWSNFYFITLGLAVFNLLSTVWVFWGYEINNPHPIDLEHVHTGQTLENGIRRRWRAFKGVIADRTTLLGAFFIFAYQGSEVSISGWVISFLVNYRGGDPTKVGYVTSGFWGGITIGRFVLSHIGNRIGSRIFVFAVVAGAFVLELLVWLVPSIPGDSIAVALAGVLLGPIYPAASVTFAHLLPRQKHISAFSFIASIGSSGGAFMPFMIGLLAQKVGTWVLHPVCIALFVAMEVFWWFLPRVQKRAE